MEAKFYPIQGRSLLLNILLILINLTGLTLLTIGFHENFVDQKFTYVTLGTVLLVLSTGGLFLLRGRLLFSYVARVIVGGVFIVSGLIKANDPLGFSYKLEEYFEDGALAYRIKEWFGAPGFSLEFLIEYALSISVIICIIEIIIGVMIIIGGKIKLMAYLLLGTMLFFTFLTWHTANCDSSTRFLDRDTYDAKSAYAQSKLEDAKTSKDIKVVSNDGKTLVIDEYKSPQCVKDCGCFGDAMKGSVGRSLTPVESLWKDYVLLYLSVWIFISQFMIKPNTTKQNWVMISFSMVVIAFFSFVFGWYLPILFGLVTLLLALWIRIAGGNLLGNHWGSILISLAICILFTSYVLMYEPIKDYRPYAVGSNLKEKMEDGVPGEFQNMFVLLNKKTGQEEEFTEKEYTDVDRKLWEDPNYEYKSMVTKEIKAGKLPSITSQFNPLIHVNDLSDTERNMPAVKAFIDANAVAGVLIYDKKNHRVFEVAKEDYNKEDYDSLSFIFQRDIEMMNPEVSEITMLESILTDSISMIIVTKDLRTANFKEIEQFKELQKEAAKHKFPFYLITSSTREDINKWRKENDFDIPVFINDGIEIKVIARSNPALLIIGKGVVLGKFPHRSLPSFNWIDKHILNK